jgi:hypothetical protein
MALSVYQRPAEAAAKAAIEEFRLAREQIDDGIASLERMALLTFIIPSHERWVEQTLWAMIATAQASRTGTFSSGFRALADFEKVAATLAGETTERTDLVSDEQAQ